MATTPTPEPKGSQSRAIHKGADLFITLFNAEKAKVTAASNRTLRDLEARFSGYQQTSQSSIAVYARRCAESEAAIRNTQVAHARAVADTSSAQEQMSEAQRQLTEVKRELEHFKVTSKIGHLSHHEGTPKFAPEQTNDGARVTPKDTQDAGVQADDLNLLVSVGELRRELVAGQQLLEEKEQKCRIIEKERDDLKATMRTEVMTLKNRILSLQTEVDSLKGSLSRSQVDSGDKGDFIIPAAVNETIRKLSPTVPREIASTSGSPATIVQKDDGRPPSKRPASAPSFSSDVKRVKRNHRSHDKVPIPMPQELVSPVIKKRSSGGISPAETPSNPSGNEVGAKQLLPSEPLKSESSVGTAASASAGHSGISKGKKSDCFPHPSEKRTETPSSRPKPKPAYRGQPETPPNPTATNGTNNTNADDITKSVPVPKGFSVSRPKPRPAYLGSNSVSASSHVPS